jgi:hypothetical protein
MSDAYAGGLCRVACKNDADIVQPRRNKSRMRMRIHAWRRAIVADTHKRPARGMPARERGRSERKRIAVRKTFRRRNCFRRRLRGGVASRECTALQSWPAE